MPTIVVDDQGHYLHYEDTGIPGTENEKPYTTLLVIHGTSFHSGTFKRLLPLAPQYNIRLVLVNRRDYPGSSPYTDEEIATVGTGDEAGQMAFAKGRAAEFTTFVQKFAEQEGIPKITEDGKNGGVALMAWSSGTMYMLPVLALADTIPESTRKAVEPYLRKFIILDTARYAFGLSTSAEGSSFLIHPSVSAGENKRSFNEWVAPYYMHKSITSGNDSDLAALPTPDAPPSTLERMTEAELKEITYPEAVNHSEIPARTSKPEIAAERTKKAFFDDEMAQKYFSKCSVDAIYCEHTMWAMIDAKWSLDKMRRKADREGIKGRPFKTYLMPKVNHFPHWDYPKEAMKFFADVIMT